MATYGSRQATAGREHSMAKPTVLGASGKMNKLRNDPPLVAGLGGTIRSGSVEGNVKIKRRLRQSNVVVIK